MDASDTPDWLKDDDEEKRRRSADWLQQQGHQQDGGVENKQKPWHASLATTTPTRSASIQQGADTATTATAGSGTNISTQQQEQNDDNENNERRNKFDCKEAFVRDWRLLLATVLILIFMNIPYVRYVMYPFDIFATWVHEFCHGMAAIMTGGKINQLLIFSDTSGLAYTTTSCCRPFVVSAGYQGTAVFGFLLLLFRRTKRGPRTGAMVLGLTMIISLAIWIRNAFGIVIILVLGLALCASAWKLPSFWIRNLYVSVAVTTTMNSITNVRDLFGQNQYVNGQPSSTDAHTMADLVGGSSGIWASVWLIFSLLMTVLGLVFAIPGPDETADFVCCGVCIDLGLFKICNDTSRWRSRWSGSSTAENNDDE